MNRIFYICLILFSSVCIGGALILFSIRPDSGEASVIKIQKSKEFSKITVIKKDQSSGYNIITEEIDSSTAKVSQNTPMLIDFGRLSTFMYLAPPGSQEEVLTQSGKTGIVIGDVSGIVSLYDLFATYQIYDRSNVFRIDQVTNGSFYIGKEKDGKIAIYAIDGVARLTFLFQNEEMTNMMLFPGSYIRFDPTRNRSLKNADLFRTILSLKDTDNEVFEFVNPRVNVGDDKDTFFNYRLPTSSIVLFRALSARFNNTIDMNEIKKKYGTFSYETSKSSVWLMNPSKKNYIRLSELGYYLTEALKGGPQSGQIIQKIKEIYEESKDADVDDTTSRELVEQFLLDGRFALYQGVSTSNYQDMYEKIAKLIGIEGTDPKLQLFQSLADIYSKNLFSQKSTDSRVIINTYSPTAQELQKTFAGGQIAPKDSFDIAIYAFNILRKMEEGQQVLVPTALDDPSTYTYFTIFFNASSRYINSIDNVEKKQQTIMSFSRQFYDYMLTLIVNSLYRSYVVANEDGAIYLKNEYVEGVKLSIPADTVSNIGALTKNINGISPSIEALWSGSGETDTVIFSRIQDNIARLNALSLMIDPDRYRDYLKSPFKVEDSSSGSLFPFPALDEEKRKPIRIDTKVIENIRNTRALSADPRIKEIKSIWPDADPSNLSFEGDAIRVTKALFRVTRKDSENSEITISALYQDNAISDMIIYYGDYTIEVVFPAQRPSMTPPSYKAFLLQLGSYLDFIDRELSASSEEIRQIRIFPNTQRVNINDSLYPVDIQ